MLTFQNPMHHKNKKSNWKKSHMEKNKKDQAEKLQIKLDKLLQTRAKKQASFDKIKKELSDLSKSIDTDFPALV